MRHISIFVLALALAAPAWAQTPDFSYDAFSARFTRTDLNDVTDDADGFTVAASYEVSDMFHLWGRLERTTFDQAMSFPTDGDVVDIARVELKLRSLGLAAGTGIHRDLTDDLSAYARFGFAYSETEGEASVSDFDGFPVTFEGGPITTSDSNTEIVWLAGVRYDVAERMELFGGVSQTGGGSSGGHAGIEFRVANGWGAQVVGVVDEDSKGLSLGVVRRF